MPLHADLPSSPARVGRAGRGLYGFDDAVRTPGDRMVVGSGLAHRLMMEVHTEGRSIVWTGAREQAENYVQKLHSHQLLASMERVDS